jgi:hypothetical protein
MGLAVGPRAFTSKWNPVRAFCEEVDQHKLQGADCVQGCITVPCSSGADTFFERNRTTEADQHLWSNAGREWSAKIPPNPPFTFGAVGVVC